MGVADVGCWEMGVADVGCWEMGVVMLVAGRWA